MKRLTAVLVLSGGLAMVSLAQAGALGVTDIVSRNVTAHGGLDAWRAVASMHMTGEMDVGGKQNARLPFVLDLKRPRKSRLEVVFQEKTAIQVYDGNQGWKLRPYLNRETVEPFSTSEAQSAASAAELDGPLVDYDRKGSKVELLGMDKVEGKTAYKLLLSPKVGPPLNLWVDAGNFLEIKIDGQPRKIDGRMRKVAIFYRDYKKVDGLTMAQTLETSVEGVAQTYKISIQSVKVNLPLPDTLFAMPAVPASVNVN